MEFSAAASESKVEHNVADAKPASKLDAFMKRSKTPPLEDMHGVVGVASKLNAFVKRSKTPTEDEHPAPAAPSALPPVQADDKAISFQEPTSAEKSAVVVDSHVVASDDKPASKLDAFMKRTKTPPIEDMHAAVSAASKLNTFIHKTKAHVEDRHPASADIPAGADFKPITHEASSSGAKSPVQDISSDAKPVSKLSAFLHRSKTPPLDDMHGTVAVAAKVNAFVKRAKTPTEDESHAHHPSSKSPVQDEHDELVHHQPSAGPARPIAARMDAYLKRSKTPPPDDEKPHDSNAHRYHTESEVLSKR